MAKRFNQNIQKKVRAYMYDAGLPESMWDLALGAAVYAYNRTPHKSKNMQIPLQKFAPNHSYDTNQIKRFGCLAYVKVQSKVGPKFSYMGRRVIFIGYTPSGYQFLKPEEGKYYESRDVKFNEKLVYKDKNGKDVVKNWPIDPVVIDTKKWFVEFEPNAEPTSDVINNKNTETQNEKEVGRVKPGSKPLQLNCQRILKLKKFAQRFLLPLFPV